MSTLDFNEDPWVVTFSPGDSLEDKLKKAAHVKPSPAQLKWMEKEYVAFVHFSINTFTGRQWGTGGEDIGVYNPTELDPMQWVKVCADAGMKMLLFTAKHHDGFCQWETVTTGFSVKEAPVKKDIVDILHKGCAEYGIGLGLYLSPWDMNQKLRGLWGSEKYNGYFLLQLQELLTRYGNVGELWFDGACSDYGIWKAAPFYQPEKWYDYIESVQPDAVFRMYDPFYFASVGKWEEVRQGKACLDWRGKAVRWVGNEGGQSRENEYSVQPVFDREIAENATWPDLGGEKYYKDAVGAVWYPLEVNTVVLNQWFWNEETSFTRSLSDLINVYYNSIGNNGVLLLNVSPDNRGLITSCQIKRLGQLKEFVSKTFSNNKALGSKISVDNELAGHEAASMIDSDKMSYWAPSGDWDINESSVSIIFELGEVKEFDNILLQEFIREGQRVAEWSLEARVEGHWREVAHYKTIGYKVIKRFEAIKSDTVRFNIIRSWDKPMISSFGLYLSCIPEEEVEAGGGVVKGPGPEFQTSDGLIPGLNYTYYMGGIQCAALIESVYSVKPLKVGTHTKIDTGPAEAEIGYSLAYRGYIHIPAESTYTFKLESANGSVLYVNEKLFIDNDEPHDIRSVEKQIELKGGYYPIKVYYTSFRNEGLLNLSWACPHFEMEEIGQGNFYHKK
ncbi:MAG: alpha-L-fucosidase [Clostridiales bacterium]|jgi:alpha-L-fucosidase|nr:alpha-L-fucosidase [Clostridiales bacterium]